MHRKSFYLGLSSSLDDTLQQSKKRINEEHGIVFVGDTKIIEYANSLKKQKKSIVDIDPLSFSTGTYQNININLGIGESK